MPPNVHSYALLPIGYPMGRFGPVRRVPLADVVYEDRWDPWTRIIWRSRAERIFRNSIRARSSCNWRASRAMASASAGSVRSASPIGTGPFKFVEFKPNERIRVTRNTDYWKQGRPYLDGIEYTIIKNLSTAILAFVAGKFDMIFRYSVTAPLLKDVNSQMPQAICELTPIGINRGLIVNRERPPFDSPDLRRAMALSLDRKAFIDIITEGQGDVGGVIAPEGLWGMPPEMLRELPATTPTSKKTARRPARSCSSWATGPRNGYRSRCRRAICHSCATRRCC